MLGWSWLVALPRYKIDWFKKPTFDASPSGVIDSLLIEQCVYISFGCFFYRESLSTSPLYKS